MLPEGLFGTYTDDSMGEAEFSVILLKFKRESKKSIRELADLIMDEYLYQEFENFFRDILLPELKERGYDLVIFDGSPGFGFMNEGLRRVSDWVAVPMTPARQSIFGTLRYILHDDIWTPEKSILLLNEWTPYRNLPQTWEEILEELRNTGIPKRLLDQVLPRVKHFFCIPEWDLMRRTFALGTSDGYLPPINSEPPANPWFSLMLAIARILGLRDK